MDFKEIALQLTLKAIEEGKIRTKGINDGNFEEVNAFNAKQISDFYISILNATESAYINDEL